MRANAFCWCIIVVRSRQMSNEPQPQSSSPNQDGVLDEEQSNLQFMKEQLEGATKQLKEATTTRGKFDSMTEILALEEGMSLEEARARALEMQEQSFGIAFEDGTVETRRRRMETKSTKVETQQSQNETQQSQNETVEQNAAPATAVAANPGAALDLHPEALPWLIRDGVCLFRDAESPFEGFEDDLLALTSRADQFAWLRVFSFFPQLNGLSAELLRAFVRSNLCGYTRNKLIDDYLVSTGQHARHDVPLGFAQISSGKVLQLEKQFPQLAAFFAGAGYIGAAHESLILLDPSCVPIVVAAYVASLVDELNENGIEVNDWTVAYAFRPDVYAHSDGGDGTVYAVLEGLEVSLSKVKHWDQHLEFYAENDEIISASQQVKRIVSQLVQIAGA
jgi:hypothetical protein